MRNLSCLNVPNGSPANGGYTLDYFEKIGVREKPLRKLTARQLEILELLAKGFYYKEIGDALGISPFTVRAHLHTVYRKLEVKSRARAVVKFQELAQQS